MSEQRRSGWRWKLIAAGFLVGLATALWWIRQPTDPLSREMLSEARSRWFLADIRSYDARYRMHGSVYAVAVRDGIVERLTVDGREPTAVDPASYSIPGLFHTLEMELDQAERLPLAESERALKYRARFHRELGYPERYVRGVTPLGKTTSIEMLEFCRHRFDPSSH